MADLTKPKLAIAVKFEMIEYKIMDNSDVKIDLSVFETREFSEETYLGEVSIPVSPALEKPNAWAINARYELEAQEYEKEIEGTVAIQAKWIPK